MTTYEDAPAVAEIAARIIADVDEYSPLTNVEVRYVWRDTAQTSKGRTLLGKARKISGLAAHLAVAADPELGFFVIEVAADTWEHLDEGQRVALVDHELAHLDVGWDDDGEIVTGIIGHDVEEFIAVARRRGAWQPHYATFREAVGQQAFDLQSAGGGLTGGGVSFAFTDSDADALDAAAKHLRDGDDQ